jgi:hypothetical protein
MIPCREECRWCGSLTIYKLGLCYSCFEEYQNIEKDAELIAQEK